MKGKGRVSRRAALAAVAAMIAVPAAVAAGPLTVDGQGLVQLAQSAAELPPQMRQAMIVGVQEELAAHGYPVGPADGKVGPRTRAAIRAYQRDAGLPVNGVPTKDLLDHLKFAQPNVTARIPAPAAPAETARPRAGKDLVLAVQRELQVRGYYTGALDGIAGRGTQAAVRAFQRDAGFPVTGGVDERLLAELRAVDPKISAGRRP